jgi:hypothetical protein
MSVSSPGDARMSSSQRRETEAVATAGFVNALEARPADEDQVTVANLDRSGIRRTPPGRALAIVE